MCFGRAMRDFALPPPPSVPLPSSPPLQNKNHHCTGKTHSLQKTTAIRISSPFEKLILCDISRSTGSGKVLDLLLLLGTCVNV